MILIKNRFLVFFRFQDSYKAVAMKVGCGADSGVGSGAVIVFVVVTLVT